MPTQSPFLSYKIECPICKTVNEFETVRVGAYTERGRDTDFCPLDIKWRFPRYDGYNPLLFFTATCSNCFYTREMNNEFRDWKNDNHFKTYRLRSIKEQHLEQLSIADSAVKRLGEAVDTTRHPNESAVLKLLLAIYDESLSERPHALDLGRFYLRIAWIFRDMARGEDSGTQLLKGMMHEIDSCYSRMKMTLEEFGVDVAAFTTTVDSHFESEQLSAHVQSQLLSHRELYAAEISGLKEDIENCEQRLNAIRQLLNEHRTALVGSAEGEGPRFGQYSSFENFLAELKSIWSGAVTNEREAIEQAIGHYKEAFANGRDISPGNQQIQASYLIAELSRRIGDYETAKEYFSSTIKAGQEFIYQNRHDQSRTILARKILELAIEQGRTNLAALKPA
ncbi:DUF2225 domain-containing protein [candidate division GN15 bacterium]|nr:DUF2225 domain-containing protein [candidate division GN15 bacterium]